MGCPYHGVHMISKSAAAKHYAMKKTEVAVLRRIWHDELLGGDFRYAHSPDNLNYHRYMTAQFALKEIDPR
jgi:hypothetical protein